MTGVVAWFTGLPASGKTTLARMVENKLVERGITPTLLDSDEVRAQQMSSLGYSPQERQQFYERLGKLAVELAGEGRAVLVAATSPHELDRIKVRRIAPAYLEVFVATPQKECAQRDPKGLYRRAEDGSLPELPGVGVEYERPKNPDFVASLGADGEIADRICIAIAERMNEANL